ncbi:hypothetical protein DB347_09900 [Opitutaceae bacterium EW11]|nr:hypothetical protein DB347_09900 [Opitutaceae bacterium EW11]
MTVSSLYHRILTLTAGLFLAAAGHGAVVERPVSTVPLATTLSDAHQVASRHGGMQVLRISGTSMLPFFGDGSVVIVKKIEAAQLRAGMVVVYQNRFGETVAHRLVAPAIEGWLAQGYNNPVADSTLVNDFNLVGVVYATFHSNGRSDALPGLTALAACTTVALAAPAR